MASLQEILYIFVVFGIPIIFVIGMLITGIQGHFSQKKITAYYKQRLKEALSPIFPQLKFVQNDTTTFHFQASDYSKNIRAFTATVDLKNRTFFPAVLTGWLFREHDKISLAVKFGDEEDVLPPDFIFEIIPYRKKWTIKGKFDYLVRIDDYNTIDKYVNQNFLIKSNKKDRVSYFLGDKRFVQDLKRFEPTLEYFFIRPKDKDDPAHMRLTFNVDTQDETLIEDYLDFFIYMLKAYQGGSKRKRTLKKFKKKN